MFWTNRTYKEEDKEQVRLPIIKQEFKSTKFIFKKKNKARINTELILGKAKAIDLRKSRQFNIHLLKSETNLKDSGLSSEQRYDVE